jgi:hypothetical protein
MKIIKYGELPEEKKYQLTCFNCTTIFEFQAHEACWNEDQRDGAYLKIDCPFCHKQVTSTP